jgi:hypothetical protein
MASFRGVVHYYECVFLFLKQNLLFGLPGTGEFTPRNNEWIVLETAKGSEAVPKLCMLHAVSSLQTLSLMGPNGQSALCLAERLFHIVKALCRRLAVMVTIPSNRYDPGYQVIT